MVKKINVAITEDHQLVRQGMVALLKEEEGLNVLFDVGNGKELLDKLESGLPDIVLLDIAMPVMDGKEALEIIRKRYPKLKVIIITSHYSNKHITEFITKGARGFLPKNCDIEKVVDAIFSVYDEGYYFDSKVSGAIVEKLARSEKTDLPIMDTGISSLERKIIRLICLEKTNNEISEALFLSKRTVEWHKTNVLIKTNSKSIIGLAKYAVENGIIDETDLLPGANETE